MCQLILCNLRNRILNGVFLTSMIREDAEAGNHDGTGLFTKGKDGDDVLWKTDLGGDGITNLGVIIKSYLTSNSPVLAHVRAASTGIVVTRENAHPFEGKRFILAHNGRLYDKDEIVTYTTTSDTSISSDSEMFLKKLEEAAEISPAKEFAALMQETMSKFKGKFAFLIYDKRTERFYAIRGKTADLYIAKIFEDTTVGGKSVLEPIGFVINTRKISLEGALQNGLVMGQLITGKEYSHGEIVALSDESIYEITKLDIKLIGDIKENSVYETQSSFARGWGMGGKHSDTKINTSPVLKLAERMFTFLDQHFLTIEDLDALLNIFCNSNVADLNVDNMKFFLDHVVPVLSARKKVREKMEKIMNSNGGARKIHRLVYTELGLQYPWMLNDDVGMDKLEKHLSQKAGK